MKSLWTKPEAALMNTRRLGALNCFCLIRCKAITGGVILLKWRGPVWSVPVHESAGQLGRAGGRLLCGYFACLLISYLVRLSRVWGETPGSQMCLCVCMRNKKRKKKRNKNIKACTPESVCSAHSGLLIEGVCLSVHVVYGRSSQSISRRKRQDN